MMPATRAEYYSEPYLIDINGLSAHLTIRRAWAAELLQHEANQSQAAEICSHRQLAMIDSYVCIHDLENP